MKNSISRLNKRVNDKVKILLEKTCKKHVPKKPEVIKYTLSASTQEFKKVLDKELNPKDTQMTEAEEEALLAEREHMTEEEKKSFEDLEVELNEISEIRYIPVRYEPIVKEGKKHEKKT